MLACNSGELAEALGQLGRQVFPPLGLGGGVRGYSRSPHTCPPGWGPSLPACWRFPAQENASGGSVQQLVGQPVQTEQKVGPRLMKK